MNSNLTKNKVYIGLSGGVDSAVSAALLQKAGYDVTGVFIKVWQPDWIECSWKEDRREAMRVAAHLGIPFVTLDLEKEYKEGVIDYMIAEYAAGRTPNPDVMCNREVKFGAFWRWAQAQGADYVATGHYARNKIQETGFYSLLTGRDSNKDQSYFLWTLNQADLQHVLFPVGDIPKPEVRKLAAKFKLPNADRKDSQGLCFIGKVDVKEFLTHYIKTEPGSVLNEKGTVIGTHPGALLFTIGERHGFTITEKTPHDAPYYVVKKDVSANTLTVSNKTIQTENISNKEVKLIRCNWVHEVPVPEKTFQGRSRYRQELYPLTIINADATHAAIRFETTQDTLTPGQSLVIYDGEVCVGGGIIE
jgi:tRNA-specific 2-thiouridylase